MIYQHQEGVSIVARLVAPRGQGHLVGASDKAPTLRGAGPHRPLSTHHAEGLERLREEILEFAAFHGLDNIRGSSRMVSITRAMKPKLTPAGSAEREEVERALKEAGKWEEVSVLNAQRLGSLLSSGALEGEILARLQQVVSYEETPSLRLRKLEE